MKLTPKNLNNKNKQKVFALVDCNNFFASCERAFNPKIRNKPVVVLSNNDGCIVARSNEAKKLKIPMGVPLFKVKDLIEAHNVNLFSANFSLYGDMSNRVMQTLREFVADIEIYSIDEAFLELTNAKIDDLSSYAQKIRKQVQRNTNIPISVGIAQTKTLAKLANHIAKKNPEFNGVCDLTKYSQKELDQMFSKIDVSEIWGIGWNLSEFLHKNGVYNVLQLKNSNTMWVKKNMHVTGLRTVTELNGTACVDLDNHPHVAKSIISSRSFGTPVTNIKELKESVSEYISGASEKLRRKNMAANFVTVFIITNRHRADQKQYRASYTVSLNEASFYTPDLIEAGMKAVDQIFKPGYNYKKSLVLLSGLVPVDAIQANMFQTEDKTNKGKQVMLALDKINKSWGGGTVKYASSGFKQKWKAKQEKRSPRYTTSWDELLHVRS